VKLERGKSPQHVAEETESDEILLHASMKASQHKRGEDRGKMASRRLPPPPGKTPIGKVLNPSCAFIP